MLVRTPKQKRYCKIFLILLKYIPPVSTFLLVIHALLCLNGFNENILDNLVQSSLLKALFMLFASYAFGFCWLHRSLVIFNLIVSVLITIHEEFGLGILLFPCKLITAIIGISLLTLLIEHWRGYFNCNGSFKDLSLWIIKQNRCRL